MNPIPFGKTSLAPQALQTLRTLQTPPAPQQACASSAHTAAPRCRVSVIIKALNEERRIEATVESALRAVATVGGEVILADSCSSDRTVELASA